MLPLLLALQTTAAEITVDTTKQTPISPYIYGVNYPNNWIYEWLDEWRDYGRPFTFAREGGNRFTAYNWETNASNAGHDYFHENDDYLGQSNEPGWTVSRFLRWVQDEGAAALVTVPTLGYVSADKQTDMYGDRDVLKTPDYLNTRFNKSFPRNPKGRQTNPDITDKAVYQDEFVAFVQRTKSSKSPVWFSLDNEPDFWYSTHPRIVGEKPTYERIIENNIAYATMIKEIAPESKVFGPVHYGWNGIRTFQGAPDANGRDFVEVYLKAMREAEKREGHRILDVYDIHYYPETSGGGVRIIYNQKPDNDETRAARIQAPRSLWDPTYIEGSWINQNLGGQAIRLIPRMQDWFAKFYPGTKLAITEYEFGGRDTISGALAQADALGVFGRYGLFAAAHWGVDHNEKPTYAAFQAWTDFDRKGSRFGDLGLAVQGETPALNSVYAALDRKNKNRLTVLAINKTKSEMPLSINLKGFKGKTVRAYAISEGIYETPTDLPATLRGSTLTFTSPRLSIVTLEVRA
jgi:hypothetical protein